jgi:hypothetical protein
MAEDERLRELDILLPSACHYLAKHCPKTFPKLQDCFGDTLQGLPRYIRHRVCFGTVDPNNAVTFDYDVGDVNVKLYHLKRDDVRDILKHFTVLYEPKLVYKDRRDPVDYNIITEFLQEERVCPEKKANIKLEMSDFALDFNKYYRGYTYYHLDARPEFVDLGHVGQRVMKGFGGRAFEVVDPRKTDQMPVGGNFSMPRDGTYMTADQVVQKVLEDDWSCKQLKRLLQEPFVPDDLQNLATYADVQRLQAYFDAGAAKNSGKISLLDAERMAYRDASSRLQSLFSVGPKGVAIYQPLEAVVDWNDKREVDATTLNLFNKEMERQGDLSELCDAHRVYLKLGRGYLCAHQGCFYKVKLLPRMTQTEAGSLKERLYYVAGYQKMKIKQTEWEQNKIQLFVQECIARDKKQHVGPVGNINPALAKSRASEVKIVEWDDDDDTGM